MLEIKLWPATCSQKGIKTLLRNATEFAAVSLGTCSVQYLQTMPSAEKKVAKWYTLLHFNLLSCFSPLRHTKKRRNKITPVSPYTLSNMFSYYVYKIRKLCPFLHYWVINLSSLSGSPVKPSSKMNYSCRQQSGICTSLYMYMYYIHILDIINVYKFTCVHYIPHFAYPLPLSLREVNILWGVLGISTVSPFVPSSDYI